VKEIDKLMPATRGYGKNQDYSQFINIYEAVRVKFPGVQVVNGEFMIRGPHSLNASSAALLVVDGMVVDESTFASVQTSEIARIDMLIGSAASVYGVRGANGVILVETKSGTDQ